MLAVHVIVVVVPQLAVEQRRRPELRGKPVAVVQYNPWKGGGLIAVSYEARECGVLRCMRGDDAKKVCPDIELLRAPWADGNAPLNWYRDAGTEVSLTRNERRKSLFSHSIAVFPVLLGFEGPLAPSR